MIYSFTKRNLTLLKGGYIRNCHQSIKMIAVVWCFATFVFVNIYSSCLTSYMSLIFQRPDINSFHDLAMAKDYDLSVVKGTNPEKMSLVKNNPEFFFDNIVICYILLKNQ